MDTITRLTYRTFWTQLRARANAHAALPAHPEPSKEWLLRLSYDGFIYFERSLLWILRADAPGYGRRIDAIENEVAE